MTLHAIEDPKPLKGEQLAIKWYQRKNTKYTFKAKFFPGTVSYTI